MTLAALDRQARAVGLAVRGAVRDPKDAPDGTQTLVLLGPDEPGFWSMFSDSAEYSDGAPDPLDRWSKRVGGGLAQTWGGTAIFPSDGPPYPPFLGWAAASGAAFLSPVGLLVHSNAGLLISYRCAIALPERLDLPPAPENPCDTCADKPCLTACPIGALGPDRAYDVPACQAYLRSDAGAPHTQTGCNVRNACPRSAGMQRPARQSAFHMAAFLGTRL